VAELVARMIIIFGNNNPPDSCTEASLHPAGRAHQLMMGIAFSGCRRYDVGALSTMMHFRTSRPCRDRYATHPKYRGHS
jgi:hypothetical protein